MADQYMNEPMLDIYIFETLQQIEKLEKSILNSEGINRLTTSDINEIFRIMHTIKGSSAMMLFNSIADLAHSLEDVFYYIREKKELEYDCSALTDLILQGIDFMRVELEKIKNGHDADGDAFQLVHRVKAFLKMIEDNNHFTFEEDIKQSTSVKKEQYYISQYKDSKIGANNLFKAVIYFEEGCEMENVRAYTIIHNIKDITNEYSCYPADILQNNDTVAIIRAQGFLLFVKTDHSYQEMYDYLASTIFLRDLELIQLDTDEEYQKCLSGRWEKDEALRIKESFVQNDKDQGIEEKEICHSAQPSIISVSVAKLDKLMDLMGEMVIAEAMVTQNPELKSLQLDSFQKAARQLKKITDEMQDMIMSIRMVPLATTFIKMQRIVRDMSKKLNKDTHLEIIGEETEVDKNILEHISDPLMHLVRNAIDHGLETIEERMMKGKSKSGTITIEAKNAGSDVLIMISDDGKGINKEKILGKARDNGLLSQSESEMTDRQIFSLIFLPGFSTKDNVTEFSGRGVGMDVVTKNIEMLGGSVYVDSIEDRGTTITLRIPLTLAIINGMNIRVGGSYYTIPTMNIRESFRPRATDIITDPEGNEMIMVRGQCYPILRMHEIFKVKIHTLEFQEGIFIMVENDGKVLCIFADELLGEQQVVVKMLPNYIRSIRKVAGLSGCTLLGDGSISLILDINGLVSYIK